MSILAKKLHILKTGSTEETANIYTSTAECPEPNLKVNVDGTNGYVKLGNVNHPFATNGRVHLAANNTDYAILKQYNISDFPLSWGKFKGFYCTLTENEAHNTWQYGWSLHFENGTLGIPVGYNATGSDVIWNENLYETITDSRLNSVFYISHQSKWKNCIAADESSSMEWFDTNDQGLGMLSYSTASIWGWPNSSVVTNNFTASVTNSVLTVYKNGTIFKTYNVYV